MRTRNARTTRAGVAVVGSALVLLVAGGAGAGPTPSQRCAVAKSKAAVKKLGSKMKCHQKALQLGGTVDPLCLTKAEQRFEAAIAKAELPGGCTVTGDAATIEAAVDFCVDSFVALTPVGGSEVCCSFSFMSSTGCGVSSSPEDCTSGGGSVQPGVCRNDGTCGDATGPGDCCDDGAGNCAVLTSGETQGFCSFIFGTFEPNTTCTVSGCQ